MVITLTDAADVAATETDDELVHTVCDCAPDLAFCGKDMTGHEWLPFTEYPDDCLVCEDLDQEHECAGLSDDVSDGGSDA